MGKLTAARVQSIMEACLYEEAEAPNAPPPDAVIVEGVMLNFGLHPGRVREHDAEIAELLAELPDGFRLSGEGGGWSFLAACEDRNGTLWGEHRDIEALMVLGVAVRRVKVLFPREMWKVLPGGMPYFAVLDEPAPAKGA